MSEPSKLGFIGLGVMGEPMCRHLGRKSGLPVIAYDLRPGPLERLRGDGVRRAASVPELAAEADIVFLSLPGGKEVRQLCDGVRGLVALARSGQTIVDLGTSPVSLARELAKRFGAKGADFADAPVARTREAAQQGTLSVMVGASEPVFRRIEPLLRCFAAEITRCGEVGAGQVVKIINNMVLFQTGVALAEALALARKSGVDGALLFQTLAKGSADSFALRNHGMNAMLPGVFPEPAFSAEYALKDLSYALEMAGEVGIQLRGAELAGDILRETVAQGNGRRYWPVLLEAIARSR